MNCTKSSSSLDQTCAPRGPQPSTAWCAGPVGMGHRLMAFTPEDRFERQPLASPDGRLVVVVDGRLDNRPELASALGISEPTAKRHWAYARAWLFHELSQR